jgi:glutathione S-transferase
MKLELVSFKICPFVQRAVLSLQTTGMDYDITYIDLSSPPDWFKQISPFGKVPVLKVNDDHVLFESAVIDEFINEISPVELLPADPLQRALNRSWIDFGSSLILAFSGLIHAADEQTYNDKLAEVKQQFSWLEQRLGDGPWFNGDSMSLVDISFAPLFMRVVILHMQDQLYRQDYRGVTRWAEQLLSIPALQDSVVPDFDALFTGHIKKQAEYVATRLGLS